ncbi:MAG: hypothetical protein H0V29_00900 [Thermoleophilaceae bacterium]|nr:hypothetical protein [Thermoleophilaceae bacterium]
MLAAALAVPAFAADRAPTRSEKSVITAATRSFLKGGTGVPNARILGIRVDGTYARAKTSAPGVDPATAILRQRRGKWSVREFGTSLDCRGVPERVREDLDLPCGG